MKSAARNPDLGPLLNPTSPRLVVTTATALPQAPKCECCGRPTILFRKKRGCVDAACRVKGDE